MNSLSANPGVVVVGGIERNYLETGQWPSPSGFWSRTLDIFTYPVEPIYDAEGLNEFMNGLVPEIKPTCTDQARGGAKIRDGLFRSHRENLSLGKLYYDESIGTAALSATVKLKDGLSVVGSGALGKEWEAKQTLDLRQRTWVRVYPDIGHVVDAAQGVNVYDIPGDDLGNRNPHVRVAPNLLNSTMLGGVVDVNVVEARELTAGS